MGFASFIHIRTYATFADVSPPSLHTSFSCLQALHADPQSLPHTSLSIPLTRDIWPRSPPQDLHTFLKDPQSCPEVAVWHPRISQTSQCSPQ